MIKWVREDNQARLEIQRDRLNILNSRLFGRVTPEPKIDPTTPTSATPQAQRDAPASTRKSGVDTKRLRSAARVLVLRRRFWADEIEWLGFAARSRL
jgi:hypothetical protein